MGLDNNVTAPQGGGTSLSIVGQKWTKRVPEGTPGAQARALTKGANAGREVWELGYPSVSGRFVYGSLGEHPGMEGVIARMILDDGEEQYEIMMGASTKLLGDLIKRLPQVNPHEEVRLELGAHKTKKTKSGQSVCVINVVQNGTVLGDYYTKWENKGGGNNEPTMLHGCPPGVKGNLGWDFREQTEFLLEKFKEFFGSLDTGSFDDQPVADESHVHEEDDFPF